MHSKQTTNVHLNSVEDSGLGRKGWREGTSERGWERGKEWQWKVLVTMYHSQGWSVPINKLFSFLFSRFGGDMLPYQREQFEIASCHISSSHCLSRLCSVCAMAKMNGKPPGAEICFRAAWVGLFRWLLWMSLRPGIWRLLIWECQFRLSWKQAHTCV